MAQLKREFGVLSGMAMVASTQIGSGIFKSPQNVLKLVEDPTQAMAVWMISGVAALFGLLCYLEMSLLLQESGAEYTYLHHGFGSKLAYLLVWAKLVIIKPVAMATALVTFGDYLFADAIGLDKNLMGDESYETAKRLLAIFCILTITMMNVHSVVLVKKTQKVFFYCLMFPIVFIIGLGFVNIISPPKSVSEVENISPSLASDDYELLDELKTQLPGNEPTNSDVQNNILLTISNYSKAFYMSMWSYDGWQAMAYAVEEMKNPEKSLPLASIAGTCLVTMIYVLMNQAYLTAIPVHEMLTSSTVAKKFVEFSLQDYDSPNFAKICSGLITYGVLCATFNTALANAFTTGRLTFVAGRHGNLPKFMSFVDLKNNTPSIALWTNCVAVISVLMLLPPDFTKLVKVMAFTQWLFHGLSFIALILLRWKMPIGSKYTRPFKVILIIPIIMAIFSIVLVLSPILSKTMEAWNENKKNAECESNTQKSELGACSTDDKKNQELFLYIWAIFILLFGYVVYFIVISTRDYGFVRRWNGKVSRVIQAVFGVVSEEKKTLTGGKGVGGQLGAETSELKSGMIEEEDSSGNDEIIKKLPDS